MRVDERTTIGPPGATAPVRTPDDRLATALDRLCGRLADALDGIAEPGAVAFLRDLARRAGAAPLAIDGSCLDLPSGRRQPVDRLVAALGLRPAERQLLLVSVLGHHHEGAAAVLRDLHPARRPWPTVGLVALLADRGVLPGVATTAEVRDLLDGGTLVRTGAIVVEPDGADTTEPERTLRAASQLWEALTGAPGWPPGLVPDPRPTPPWGLDRWLDGPDARAARAAVEQQAGVAVAALGDRPAAAAARLAALVYAAGAEPVVLRAAAVVPDLVRAALVLGAVRAVVPIICDDGTTDGRGVLDLGAVDGLVGRGGPLLVATRAERVAAWPTPVLTVPVGPLDSADRLDAVAAACPELGEVAAPIGPATVEPTDVAIAVADVRARAVLLGARPDPAALHRDLAAAVDARTTDAVPVGAALVHPRAGWDDLVLPDEPRRQLHEAVDRMQHRPVVLDEWGFLDGRTGRRGLRLLFCGPPGTGKTLAAEVVAGRLGRDLLVVDLSRLVSKWIGETEKNLAEVFDAAERGGAAVLFDEADALFGKRTEVGDARDRYANLETAYLLSRLERFDGIAFLATNLRKNLDAAFARRIEFIVAFDPPDVDARLDLWRRHLPAAAPLDERVDLGELAALYELPGALIRNAAVAAAFLAASEAAEPVARDVDATEPSGPMIAARHLVHAIRREYAKAGEAFPGAPAGTPI